MEMGIYEDNRDVKSLPGSPTYSMHQFHQHDRGKNKKSEGGKNNTETSGVYGSFSDFFDKKYQKPRSIV